MHRKAGVLVSFLLLLWARPSLAITTTNLGSTTPQQLAQLLAGPGVTVSNVTFTGANVAGGTFAGGALDGLNIDSGVMLSSGDIANGVGPNDQDGAGTCNVTPGDTDLDAILGQTGATHDAAVLEFNFVPATSTVSFRYVFASEEYNEYVGSINDIFAFFIDGQNVALIPNTSTPVSINTVNLNSNPSFYNNNDPSDFQGPTPFGTQFDGFTTVLTASRTLTANVSHHIKLVIADNVDCILDSAVFLQAGSFVGQPALTISKSAPSSVTSGTNLTYTITYGNTGNTNATGVVVKDTIPAGTSFVSATNGGQLPSGVVTWNIGTVNAGVTGQTVSFTVNVNATSGSVTNSTYSIEAAGISPIPGSAVSTTVLSAGCPTITVSPATLPNGTLAVPYNQTITASGGTAPHFFSVTAGSLPPGLFLSGGGLLSGTPTSSGAFSFTVRATDANECSGSRAYSISIGGGGCETLTLSPSSLLGGAVGVPYHRALTVSGGAGPDNLSLTAGSLPPGVALIGGVLSGTPTAIGTFTFRITARDANECTASRNYALTIGCPLVTLSPTVLPPASLGLAYNQTIAVSSGGPRQYTFSVTPGLPDGLTLSTAGVLSGVPGQTGSFTFTVTATDAFGCATSRAYTLGVCTALIVAPAALPPATAGVPYGQALAVSGGTAPYGFAVTGGALPPGLTLSGAGLLAGTPSDAGTFSFTLTATDASGCTGSTTYTLSICSALTVSPASFPGGAVGIPYSETVTVSGGTAPYAFAASGSLAPGVALSPAGTLSGTPTQSGDFAFTVTAFDVNGCSGSRNYALRVTDSPPVITSLRLTPGPGEGFTLSVIGTGFVNGGTIFVDGVAYPATFVSPTMVTVALPTSAIPTNGSITVTVTNPGPTGATSNPASLTFCAAPEAPVDASIEPLGNPTGPLTATDFLVVRWQAPASGPPPASYEFRINGDADTTVVGATSAVVPPRGSNDPITLFVRAKCNDQVGGPEIASPTYSLSPPVADFTFSAARAGSPVTFTDTSSPQATSWLWIFDDGGTSTVQSPAHTFSTAGTHRVALIASNGSGSSQVIKEVQVSAATSGAGSVTASLRRFETLDGSRWRLRNVPVSRFAPVWLQIASEQAEESVVYLRFLDPDGQLVLERRLSVVGGESAINDVAAYGLDGLYTLELVSSHRIEAILRQPFDLGPKRSSSR